jgi:hypothetical protein
MRDQVLHPYKMKSKITALNILQGTIKKFPDCGEGEREQQNKQRRKGLALLAI